MQISDEYRNIYNCLIGTQANSVIVDYDIKEEKYIYKTFGHKVESDSVEKLARLMRLNLTFYCYGEEEVVKQYKNGRLDDLDQNSVYAYKQRLPKRKGINDGLLGETLLDLLIQLYEQNTYKLAVRTLFRQNDNNEIKGYDLTYFCNNNNQISLWLGQAKMGDKEYCKSNINSDLNTKYTLEYIAQQLFFICDKPLEICDEAKEILEKIEEINRIEFCDDDRVRAEKLSDFFIKNNIRIIIPCLLAYGKGSVYSSENEVVEKINKETDSIKRYFEGKTYPSTGIDIHVVYYIFPIKDLEIIRSEKRGFYSGL